MKPFLTIICIFLFHIASTQVKEVEYGIISSDEAEMNNYAADQTANAVVLFDKGASRFIETDAYNYDIEFNRHKRIKIFDSSDKENSEIKIPYYIGSKKRKEEVKSIKAQTINYVNGEKKVTQLNPETIYDEKLNDDWRQKKFVFPNVQDGAILELSYTVNSPFKFNLPDWAFQNKIPTIYSEYQVAMVPFYEYSMITQGINSFDFYKEGLSDAKREWGNGSNSAYGGNYDNRFQEKIYTYVLNDVPAFKDENFITSINDYIIKMDFQLSKVSIPGQLDKKVISTWPKLNADLLTNEYFGFYMKQSKRFAKKILSEDLHLGDKSNEEKIAAIINYVKENYEWNGRKGKFATQKAKEFQLSKTGNVGDINLFLIALLNEADIDVEPVILSSRDHGKINVDYPFSHFTNYVVALIKNKNPFLADATDDLLPFHRLPLRTYNDWGLIVNKDDEAKWITFSNTVESIEKNVLTITIDPESKTLSSLVSIQNTEYEAYTKRQKYRNDENDIEDYYSEKVGSINKSVHRGYEKNNNAYVLNFKTEFEPEIIGKKMLIKPFLNLPLSENKLTQEERTYPVDFGFPFNNIFESQITIPEGYTIDFIPENFQKSNDLVTINLNYSQDGSNIRVIGNYQFHKAIYAPENYQEIKEDMDLIVSHFNELIIIEQE